MKLDVYNQSTHTHTAALLLIQQQKIKHNMSYSRHKVSAIWQWRIGGFRLAYGENQGIIWAENGHDSQWNPTPWGQNRGSLCFPCGRCVTGVFCRAVECTWDSSPEHVKIYSVENITITAVLTALCSKFFFNYYIMANFMKRVRITFHKTKDGKCNENLGWKEVWIYSCCFFVFFSV